MAALMYMMIPHILWRRPAPALTTSPENPDVTRRVERSNVPIAVPIASPKLCVVTVILEASALFSGGNELIISRLFGP